MEYKFRAKNKNNGNWEYGYYVKYIKRQVSPIGDFLDESDVVHLIFQSGFADWNMERPLNAVEVIPETVGMFTGLTDKNSVEIYEGDVVHCISQYDNANMAVVFEDGEFRMVLEDKLPQYETGMGFFSIYCFNKEVIGNIHD